MEQWGSDFSFEVDIEELSAIERIATAFASPSEGGSYEAHLIGVIESKSDKFDEGMLTPTEKVVYSFEQHDHPFVCAHYVKSNHCDSNWEEVNAEGARLNALIHARVSKILEDRHAESERQAAKNREEDARKREIYERQQLEALKQKYNQ